MSVKLLIPAGSRTPTRFTCSATSSSARKMTVRSLSVSLIPIPRQDDRWPPARATTTTTPGWWPAQRSSSSSRGSRHLVRFSFVEKRVLQVLKRWQKIVKGVPKKRNYYCPHNGILSLLINSNIFIWLEVMLLMTKYSNEVSFIDLVNIQIQLNNFKCRRFFGTPFIS